MTRTINAETLQLFSYFEMLTRVKLKDCIIKDEIVIFIVDPNMLGKAVGKNGITVKKIELKLQKKVRIIEYNPQLERFIKNAVYPAKIKEITENEGIVTVIPEDLLNRGVLIGRNGKNLRNTEEIIKRFFNIQEIKVK